MVVYLDDILVYSANEWEHQKHLSLIFAALENAGLHVKKSKCLFFQTSVDFLGHVIDANGIHPDSIKV